jgi:hypothetical protein
VRAPRPQGSRPVLPPPTLAAVTDLTDPPAPPPLQPLPPRWAGNWLAMQLWQALALERFCAPPELPAEPRPPSSAPP